MSKTSSVADTKAVSKPPKHKGIKLPYERRKALYGYGLSQYGQLVQFTFSLFR